MELLGIFERIVGHLAWPVAAYMIIRLFRGEIKSIIQRIKTAKYRDVEINLEKEIEEIKSDAESAGVTIRYPEEAFSKESIDNLETAPELVFIKSWQEIDDLISSYYANVSGLTSKRFSSNTSLKFLLDRGIIDEEMEMLLRKLRNIRNSIVHSSESSITRGEALVWLGISKSVKDRLAQKLSTSS